MDGESVDNVIAFIAASLTIGIMWYIGIFGLFDIFFAEWVKYAAAIFGFFVAYGMGLNMTAFSSANKEIAYEDDENNESENQKEDSAIQTLKNKFAEGEISEEEFNRKKEILQDGEQEAKACPECGKEVENNLEYCTSCGEKL